MKSELIQEAIRNLRVEDIELKPFNNNLLPPRIIGPECAREIYRDADGVLQSRPYKGNPFGSSLTVVLSAKQGVCAKCGFSPMYKDSEGVERCMACDSTKRASADVAPKFPGNAEDAIRHMAKVRQGQ